MRIWSALIAVFCSLLLFTAADCAAASVDDVILLKQHGVSDEVVRSFIEAANGAFNPTMDDIKKMREAKVPDEFIALMFAHDDSILQKNWERIDEQLRMESLQPQTVVIYNNPYNWYSWYADPFYFGYGYGPFYCRPFYFYDPFCDPFFFFSPIGFARPFPHIHTQPPGTLPNPPMSPQPAPIRRGVATNSTVPSTAPTTAVADPIRRQPSDMQVQVPASRTVPAISVDRTPMTKPSYSAPSYNVPSFGFSGGSPRRR